MLGGRGAGMRRTTELAILVLLVGCREARAPAQRPAQKPAYRAPAVPSGSECFRFTASPRLDFYDLPKPLALTREPVSRSSTDGAFRVLPDEDPHDQGERMALSYWAPTEGGSLTLHWGNGFYGVSLELHRVGNRLEGLGTEFSDMPGGDMSKFKVSGERVTCPS